MCNKIELLELNKENFNKAFNLNITNLDEILNNKKLLLEKGIKYGIIYNYDSVNFGKLSELTLDINNILEARLFNDNYEIVVRVEDDNISGNIFIDNIGNYENYSVESFVLYSNKHSINDKYSELSVKNYIDYDEDGQAYYYYMKPCKLGSEK